MFAFSIVKKLGEGRYLNESPFILERVRKERALNSRYVRVSSNKCKKRIITRDERPGTS